MIITLTVGNIVLFIITIIFYFAYRNKKQECEADLCEIQTIIANNNEIIRKTMKPINGDGSLNGAYFTNDIIYLDEEK